MGLTPARRRRIGKPSASLFDTRTRLPCIRQTTNTASFMHDTHRQQRHASIGSYLLQRKRTSTAVDPSVSPTTIDAATFVLDPHLLNTSVERTATACTRRSGTLPTLDNFQRRDEPLIQESLLGDALSDAVEALVDTGEPGIDIGKQNHWHTCTLISTERGKLPKYSRSALPM